MAQTSTVWEAEAGGHLRVSRPAWATDETVEEKRDRHRSQQLFCGACKVFCVLSIVYISNLKKIRKINP